MNSPKKQMTKKNAGKIKLSVEETEITGAEGLPVSSGIKAGASFAPSSTSFRSFRG